MRKIIKTYLEYNMNISKAAEELYMQQVAYIEQRNAAAIAAQQAAAAGQGQ